MTPPGPGPGERARLRFQLVTTPIIGGTVAVLVGLFLQWAGEDAVVPGWPFVLGGLGLVAYALLVGRRLVGGPAPGDRR